MSDEKKLSDKLFEEAKQFIHYEKNAESKIAYLTLDRPGKLNAPGSGMRRLYARYVFEASIDDDVKVLVVRANGKDFGTGADIEEMQNQFGLGEDIDLNYEMTTDDGRVTYPHKDSFRHLGAMTDFFARAASGNRPLQEFKKISIVQVQGYCYGWHFYQAGDADLVVASDDALFGHAAFRYAGWGPRMWTWTEMMGVRKFKEMLFTGRPFTADQMERIGFINSVVPRDQLAAETEKYAKACAATRPMDTVHVQKTFFEMYSQYRGEYMGSVLTGLLEGVTRYMTPDRESDLSLDIDDVKAGINNSVKDADMQYPPEWRLSRSNRKKP